LKQHVELKSNWKGLEIGAGTGLVGLQLAPYLHQIVFEDTSAAMLDVLKQKLNGDLNSEIIFGEVTEYNKRDIDLVFSCMAFHHIPEIKGTLDHLFKITNSGALVVIGDLLLEDGSFHRFEPIPHKGFELEQLKIQFVNAGFKIVTAYTYDTLTRERVVGKFTDYEQFILIAMRN
jgi:trans-aconitate methyltransferase